VITIARGRTPTSTGSPGVFVAVSIGVTVPDPMLAT
jgi:hypothetical protein